MKRIEAGECISTMQPEGYNVYQLFVSDLLQDISIYPWEDAEKYDLSGYDLLCEEYPSGRKRGSA